MRLVLDTNVVISALLWAGKPRSLFRAAVESNHLLFSSTPLLAELADVLSRSKFENRIAQLQLSSSEFVELYAGRVSLVEPISVPRLAPDPDDDVVIGTAMAAEADLLVTGDRTLLSVGEYESVRIVSLGEALDAVTRSVIGDDL